MAPAARSRATAAASFFASMASTLEPARVTSPATSNKSLSETGSPSIGERRTPAFLSRSAWSASLRALSA